MTKRTCVVFFVCLLTVTHFVLGQTDHARASLMPSGDPPSEMFYVAKGDNMPFYFTVERFYGFSYTAFRMGEEMFYWNVLKKVNVELGTPAAKALEDALVAAQPVINAMLPMEPGTDTVDWERQQREFLLDNARKLGTIYGSMILELEKAGVDLDMFRQFLESEIAPTGAIVSTDPNAMAPGSDASTACEVFDQQVERIVAAAEGRQ